MKTERRRDWPGTPAAGATDFHARIRRRARRQAGRAVISDPDTLDGGADVLKHYWFTESTINPSVGTSSNQQQRTNCQFNTYM